MPEEVKITVLKKLKTGEILEEYGKDVEETCPFFEVGKEFHVGKDLKMPEGFCSWAWADIHRDIVHLALGGDFFWIKEKGVMISSCTDGLRPVVFKLERVKSVK